jgi:organic radical activating enzyme
MGAQAKKLVGFYDWSQIAARTEALYLGQGRGADYNDEAIAALRRGDSPPPPAAPLRAYTAPVDPVEAHLPPREPSKPLTLLLLINRGCNLRCAFCDLWDRGQNMPLPQVLKLLDEALAIGTRTLVITGGEPFLHPQLFDVVRAAKARGLSVNITTNGTLVERRWAELTQSGVDSLSMSLDGLETTHDQLRGKVGAFTQTVRALRRVKDEAGITTSVYFTVTNQNVHELVPVFELAQQLRAGFDFWPVNDAPRSRSPKTCTSASTATPWPTSAPPPQTSPPAADITTRAFVTTPEKKPRCVASASSTSTASRLRARSCPAVCGVATASPSATCLRRRSRPCGAAQRCRPGESHSSPRAAAWAALTTACMSSPAPQAWAFV